MEIRDLYDKNKNVTGKTIYKGEEIPKGYYEMIVIIFMEHKDGRFLMQKRSKEKNGKWASTGGHPKKGETSFKGLLTEVKEELGLDISNENIKLIDTKIGKDKICDLYYVKMDIDLDKIVCQKEEVEKVKLFTIGEIKQMIKEDIFGKNHGKAFLDVLSKIK